MPQLLSVEVFGTYFHDSNFTSEWGPERDFHLESNTRDEVNNGEGSVEVVFL